MRHGSRLLPRGPLVLGALVLVLCSLVAASFDGPRRTGPDLDRSPARVADDQQGEARDEGRAAAVRDGEGSPPPEDEPWLPWLPSGDLLLLIPAALVFALALVVVARLRVVRRRRLLTGRREVRRGTAPGGEVAPEEEPASSPRAHAAGADDGHDGPARNAVVAVWVRLERAVEGQHLRRRPAETPAELVERAVATYDLDRIAIDRLAELYREARFSTHPVTDAHRREAVECLDRLFPAAAATPGGDP